MGSIRSSPARWSPRAFTGDPIPDETLLTMFEAARWAPSCFNLQPWRFLYAKKDGEHWLKFLNLLDPLQPGLGEECLGAGRGGVEAPAGAPEPRSGPLAQPFL